MRALVVGATGFVGLNVVDALLAAGWSVRATRRKQSATVLLGKRPIELAPGALEDGEALRRAMDGQDAVFVTGAYYPRYSLDLAASLDEGVRGVRTACEAALAAGVPRLVYTSTIATLARAPAGRVACEGDVEPRMPDGSVYRAVKWAMEEEVLAARARGLDAVALLPGGCIGPWDMRLGTGSVIVGVVRGSLPWWVEGTVNLVDVGDVARAHVEAARRPCSPRIALAGHSVRVGWLLPHLAARYGGRAPTLRLSAEEAQARAEADERDAAPRRGRVAIPRELVDMAVTGQAVANDRARAELDFDPAPLDEALDRAHAWLQKYLFIPRFSPRERSNDDRL